VAFAEVFLTGPIGLDAGHGRLLTVFAEDDALAARRLLPAWHVANVGRAIEPARVRAVRVGDPQIRRALAIRHEANLFSVGRPARIAILGLGRARDIEQVARGGIGDEHLGVARADGSNEQLVAGEIGGGHDGGKEQGQNRQGDGFHGNHGQVGRGIRARGLGEGGRHGMLRLKQIIPLPLIALLQSHSELSLTSAPLMRSFEPLRVMTTLPSTRLRSNSSRLVIR
jgi:hypothetical protein